MSVLKELHPRVLSDEHGKKVAVQIEYELFSRIIEELEDLEDIIAIDERSDEPSELLEDVVEELNW